MRVREIRERGTYDTCNTLYDDMGRYGREERQGNECVSTAGSVADRGATRREGLTRRVWGGHYCVLVQRRQRQRQRREGWERDRERERRRIRVEGKASCSVDLGWSCYSCYWGDECSTHYSISSPRLALRLRAVGSIERSDGRSTVDGGRAVISSCFVGFVAVGVVVVVVALV